MTPAELKRELLMQRIELAIEGAITSLVEQVAELVPTLVREQLAAILENATAAAAPATAKVKKSKAAIATPAKSTEKAASSSSGLTSKGTPRKQLQSCSICREPGKRADSCGKTHNVKPKKTSASKIVVRGHHTAGPAPDVAPVVVTPDTPPPARSDRYSAIELANAKRRIAERSAARVDTGARPARGVRRPIDPGDSSQSVGLPTPLATFEL